MTKRAVIFGGSGFVGSHIAKKLQEKGFETISVSRKDCDYTNENCREVIRSKVQDGDVVVCAAAKAPAKDYDMLLENITLITNITEAIRDKKLSYVLNVSSDAVFADSMEPLDENSEMAPLNAHGIMHCMREKIIEQRISAPVGHIRPTLIFGAEDPHNGYGPNRFVRQASEGQAIPLFGEGEERRDHVFVEDVAAIAASMVEKKIAGGVNAVTGKVTSFMDIAKAAEAASNGTTKVQTNPRSGPMPHNGYRAFDSSKAKEVCDGIQFYDVTDYVKEAVSGSVQLTKSA